jgi:predicted amidohydrolase YtcJ
VTRRLFVAAHVHTFSHPDARGDALLTCDGRIERIGARAELRKQYPDAQVIDLGDVVLTPGLTDAHIHVTEWALARSQVQLAEAPSIEACLALVARAPRSGGWLQGRGWNPHHWGGGYPDRRHLDGVTGDLPAAFQSHDMHALWVNTRALQLAGITRDTADPPGGRIVRDAQGEPTGMLLETAAQIVITRIPRIEAAEIENAVLAAQRALHGFGITGIHSFPGVHLPEPDPLPVLTRLQERDALRLRVLQHIAADKLDAAIHLGLRSGWGGDWLRLGGVKLFLDGALGSRTAWMREPYEHSEDLGVQVLPRAEFEQIVARAAHAGIASVVHAIGDAAVAMAFEVLSAAPRVPALPHRVEHVQCFPQDCAALLRHGIVCSVQPGHLMTDWRAADRHWGRRAASTYAFRTLLDGGAVLACGSDAPVEPADPRLGLYAAVARRDGRHQPAGGWQREQCISTSEALAGYTVGAATAAGAHDVQGVLQSGAFADFAAWSQDPLACPPEQLLDLEVAATVVNGEVVWEA